MIASAGSPSRPARPASLDALAGVGGVGASKLERYGEAVLRVVRMA